MFTFINNGNGNGCSFSNIQIEEGDTTTAYEEYKEDKKDILLPVEGGSKGLPSGVCDEQYGNGDYLQKIERYLITGNENDITISKEDETYCLFSINNVLKKPIIRQNNINIVTNNYINIYNYINLSEGCFINTPSENWNSIYICVKKIKASTVEQFREMLRGEKTTVYYELAEPILHKAETPTDHNLETFKDITHVSCLNKISPSEIKTKFPVDVAATLSRLNVENKNLEKENMELKNEMLEQATFLAESDLSIIKQNVDIDFRLMEVEFALDIPLNLKLNITINKGDVNMARTPFEMMKIVILSGSYDKEDYLYKARIYHERGRMTKEEYDELIDLMTADEVVNIPTSKIK